MACNGDQVDGIGKWALHDFQTLIRGIKLMQIN